jgi:Protein of unknown function (DUF1761)
MKVFSPIVAGLVYFALGGLWFTPLFGKAWDKAVGFDRPPRWRPPLPYYLGPLVGCLVVAFAMNALLAISSAITLDRVLLVASIAGLGFSACVTSVNAISPNVPQPALYAIVVGGYHVVGALLCALTLHAMG